LNCRPHPYQGCALPTELPGPKTKTPSRTIAPIHTIRWRPATPLPLSLERVMGIEPTPSAWKAEVLPLNYTRESPRPQNRIRRLRTTRRSKSLQAISSNLSSVLILPRSWGDFTVHTLVEGGGLLRASCPPPSGSPRFARRSKSLQAISSNLSSVLILPRSWGISLSTLWWRGEDSNLRRLSRQIYSLIPLTAREPLRKRGGILWQRAQHVNYRIAATAITRRTTPAPVEPPRPNGKFWYL
jgi:hypothetical protein